jgi:RimJ/RimL family protein N-acetyltransferase
MDKFEYLRGDKLLLPYSPGLIDFKETVLVDMYNKLHEDDLYEIVFHDNPKMSLNQFITFFTSGLAHLAFFCVIENEVEVPAGLCWICDIVSHEGGTRKGNVSFCFFKEFQNPKYTNDLGRMALEYWMNVLQIDLIYASTPVDNRLSVMYVKRVGFKEVGRIPNYCFFQGNTCASMIIYIDRDIYKERYGNG